MCGIFGVIGKKAVERTQVGMVRAMTESLLHRGPDSQGVFKNEAIVFGVCRLAILDVKEGQQPMFNEDKNVCAGLNGEIYNFIEARGELIKKGHIFHTNTDTEVLAHLYEEEGENFVQHLRGMFAFILWDEKNKKAILARDRLGIKPLYYTLKNGSLYFASEIKTLLLHPDISRELNIESLHHYLTYLYAPGEDTFFSGIKKLMPGHVLTWQNGIISARRYWDIPETHGGQTLTEKDWLEQTETALRECVKLHLISDVPLGAFLSGGIDSSLLAALMTQEKQKVKTFSIGFEGGGYYNELPFAKEVADILQTEHHEFFVTPDIVNALPKIIWHCDEPLADASLLPNYYLSQYTRQNVTVAISGLGGDELFGGYLRYSGDYFTRVSRWIPRPVMQHIAKPALGRMPVRGDTFIGNKIRLAKKFVDAAPLSPARRYVRWNTFLNEEEKMKIYDGEMKRHNFTDSYIFQEKVFESAKGDFVRKAQTVDLKTYLPGDILMLTDRMTMAHGLEGRVPFCDHLLVELAMQMPSHLKVRGAVTKYILRKISEKYLPHHIVHREKHGFAVPIDIWFRGQLKPILTKAFSDENLKKLGFFNKTAIHEIMARHFSGREDLSQTLFALLMFDAWHKLFFEQKLNAAPSATLDDMYA